MVLVGSGLAAFGLVWGCGLDVVGTLAAEGEGGSEAGLPDGTIVVQGDGATCVVSGAEICNDGIDNDCNGLVDCLDPGCAGHACVTIPQGWSAVTVTRTRGADAGIDPDAGSGCPTGWANPRVLVDNPRGQSNNCACRCGATPPGTNTCVRDVDVQIGIDSNNDGNCGDRTPTLNLDGTCQLIPFTWGGGPNAVDRIREQGLAPQNVACPVLSAVRPPVVDDGALVACDLTATTSTCTSGTACIPPGGITICLAQAGNQPTCPAGFPSRRVVVPATGITDNRTCAAGCQCTTNTASCDDRRLRFYDSDQCDNQIRDVPVNDTCTGPGGSGTPTHYRYTANPNPATVGCVVQGSSSSNVVGGLALPAQTTICCPP